MKRCMRSFIFLAMALLPFSLSAQTLRIETIGVAPFGFTGPDGKPTGMMYEISNRIAQEAGIPFTNEIVPYARTIFDLKNGTADFVLRFSNDQLPEIAIPVGSVISMPTIIIFPAGSSYKTLNDFHGKTVALLRGGKFDERFDNDSGIKKYEANDYGQMLKMLTAGRIDGAIGTNVGLYFSAQELGIKPETLAAPLVLNKKDFLLHFSKMNGSTPVMNALKAALEKLKKSGEIKKIVSKYMGSYQWELGNSDN